MGISTSCENKTLSAACSETLAHGREPGVGCNGAGPGKMWRDPIKSVSAGLVQELL